MVPEVVSYEENGKDARGMDYNRRTALLIEAVKRQQTQIAAEQKQIALQQSQIRKQQRLAKAQQLEINKQQQLMTAEQREIAGLSRKVGAVESSLRSSHRETASVLVSRAKEPAMLLLSCPEDSGMKYPLGDSKTHYFTICVTEAELF